LLGNALALATDCLVDLGEHNIAEPWLRESIELARKKYEHVNLGIRLSNLASLLHDVGRFDEAGAIMAEARRYPAVGGKNSVRLFEEEKQVQAIWMKERSRKYDIMISYNSRDEEVVADLHNALEAYGLNVFIFREDPTSANPMAVTEVLLMIVPHLIECRSLLVVASATSITSAWVEFEVMHALDAKLPVPAWYPRGTRMTPQEASAFSETSPSAVHRFARRLFDRQVRSYYGLGIQRGTIADLADAIAFRYLLLSPNHPLRNGRDLTAWSRRVRHPTWLAPYLVDDQGHPLGPARGPPQGLPAARGGGK
jgi:hypothetical protein